MRWCGLILKTDGSFVLASQMVLGPECFLKIEICDESDAADTSTKRGNPGL